MGFVKDAVSGVTNTIFGGEQHPRYTQGEISQPEIDRLNGIETDLNNLYQNQPSQVGLAQKDQQIQDLFRDHVIDFISGSANTKPTPEQLAQATQFVDQTFTAPTQTALNQYQSDYTDQANARAAALGRNPNADIATQQAIYGEGQRNMMNLQNQRGAQIQQTAMGLNQLANDRDVQRLGVGMQGVNTGIQSSAFLNALQQQAMTNRMNLLNQKSGLANFYQKERGRDTAHVDTDAGFMGNLNSGLGQIAQTGQNINKIGTAFGSMFS